MKKIIAALISFHLVINAYSISLSGGFLAPPGTSAIDTHLLKPAFSDETKKLFEKYYPEVEKNAVHYYYLCRYLFQELAEIPFNKFTKEDFTSQAKVTMCELLVLSDSEYLHSKKFIQDLYLKIYVDLSKMVAGESENLLPSKLYFWIIHLSEAIRHPGKTLHPKKTLRDSIALSKEDIFNYFMDKYKNDKDRFKNFINRVRQEEASINPDTIKESAEQRRFPDPLEITATRDLQDYVQRKIELLPWDKQIKLRLRYGIPGGYDYSTEEIGKVFGVGGPAIGALEGDTIRTLLRKFGIDYDEVEKIMEARGQPGRAKKYIAPSDVQLKIYRYLSRLFSSSYEETGEKEHSSENDALRELWLSRMRVFPYSKTDVDVWQGSGLHEQQTFLDSEKENALLKWMHDTFTYDQRVLLPYVLQGWSDQEIAEHFNRNKKVIAHFNSRLLPKLRLWFTLGEYDTYGTFEQVREALIKLYQETSIHRILRLAKIDDLLMESKGNIESIKDLILQLYPGSAAGKDLKQQLDSHFRELSQLVKKKPRQHLIRQPHEIVEALRRLIAQLGDTESESKKLILRNIMRNLLYPLMRHDEEHHSEQGLNALQAEAERMEDDPLLGDPLMYAYVFYREARQFTPRGFNPIVDGRSEPMLPFQKYGIWEALLSLEEPKEEEYSKNPEEAKRQKELALLEKPKEQCAFFTSEARVGKTIMAVLAAFNIKNKKGEYDVQRVIYTTWNQPKFEVEEEVKRRIAKSLKLKVIVVDGTRKDKEAQLNEACSAQGNVLLIANYESDRDLPEKFVSFESDVHIIDEIENLRRGDKTKRAPKIFNIPCKYRIGISARMVVKKGSDIAEAVSWARKQQFPHPRMLKKMKPDTLYLALNAVSVRWRRSIVLPELGDPEYITVKLPYSTEQDRVIHSMRTNFVKWELTEARKDKSKMKDHLFNRFDLERRASVDLSLVMDGENLTAKSPKIKKLCEIIEEEKKQNGKVLVLVDFVEEIDRLVAFLDKKFGAGTACGITSKIKPLSKRNKRIRKFRSEPEPSILIGTSFLLGSSLNLFQLPGRSFHISTLVRLSRPWMNMDDGERLIGIGQTHPVKVITLISTFKTQPKRGKPMKTMDELQEMDLTKKKMEFEMTVDGKIPDEAILDELRSISAEIRGKIPRAHAAGIDSLPQTKIMNTAN